LRIPWAGIVQHQHAIGRAALDQQVHALLIEGERIPRGIRQQMLQFLRGRSVSKPVT